MKRSLLAGIAVAGALVLSGCMTDDIYGPPLGYADIDYAGYYDGYYGPFSGGYWGPSGLFYYLDQSSGRFHPDRGAHFRHDGRPGFNPIHGHAPPAAGRGHHRPGQGHAPGPGPHQ